VVVGVIRLIRLTSTPAPGDKRVLAWAAQDVFSGVFVGLGVFLWTPKWRGSEREDEVT